MMTYGRVAITAAVFAVVAVPSQTPGRATRDAVTQRLLPLTMELVVDPARLEAMLHQPGDGPVNWSMPTLERTLVDSAFERVPIFQPPDEPPLPFERFRAVSGDGKREMRLIHWHTASEVKTDAFYVSERDVALGPLDGSLFRLTRLQTDPLLAPCLTFPGTDMPRLDPFGPNGVFRRRQVQLPRRMVRVVFVPTDAFINEASQPNLESQESILNVLWMALVNLNAAAGLFHRELNIELAPVLSWNIKSAGPKWRDDESTNFDLIRDAIGQFCEKCKYDLGHALVGTNQRGWGTLRKGCDPTGRSAGYSPSGKPAVIAHEMAHQLGAFHTFNQGEAWHIEAAVEPADGSTMMVHQISRYYFHAWSSGEILEYLKMPSCAAFGTVDKTPNHSPLFTGPPSRIQVPPQTSLRFDLLASDTDGDPLRLRCEGTDRATRAGAVPPVFESSIDVADGAVITPRLENVLMRVVPNSEAGQSLRVVCTARDHKGGIAIAPITVTVTGREPFTVQTTPPNNGESISVVWTQLVAGGPAVSTATVRLQLINDGGDLVSWVPTATGGSYTGKLPAALKPGKWRVWAQPVSKPFFAVSEPFTVQ